MNTIKTQENNLEKCIHLEGLGLIIEGVTNSPTWTKAESLFSLFDDVSCIVQDEFDNLYVVGLTYEENYICFEHCDYHDWKRIEVTNRLTRCESRCKKGLHCNTCGRSESDTMIKEELFYIPKGFKITSVTGKNLELYRYSFSDIAEDIVY